MMRFAALDIGTVTCRLLIASVEGDKLVEIERQCAITNLGIDVDKTGVLRSDAIDRVVDQVSHYVSRVKSYTDSASTIPLTAIATSASRDAKNASDLVKRLDDLGVELSVIAGQREAALSFKGASRAFPGENLLVVDIGGGSTEVIMGKGGEDPVFSHSFDIGCRRVTERFLFSDPPLVDELDIARNWIYETMKPLFDAAERQGCVIDRIVAVAGTATSTVAIDKKMEVYDPARVDSTVVPHDTLERIYDELRALPLTDRREVVGLEPDRASVIVAGMLILLVILELAGKGEFTVSESDILQGIVMDAARNFSHNDDVTEM